ncbi:MAG: DNA repair protein RecO C-terminal domain-containing protein [Rickettsiales bacterium]|jgi:very-short-patch-repair endonuclease|nr:DNA repair protein RecO C-terminal domain-containing protein [Rickettsiales bacterium]
MKLESVGIIISLRPFGERDMVAKIFTADFGIMTGLIRGGAVARKNRPMVGQMGAVSWNARLSEQLGAFHFESQKNIAAAIMSDPHALARMNAAFALLETMLPEREPVPELFDATINMLCNCHSPLEGESQSASETPRDAVRGYDKRTLSNAQSLRKKQTSAEKLFWWKLGQTDRNCLGFRRQQPIGNYIADFINHEKKIIIELDGGIHNTERQYSHDTIRDEFLSDVGYRILRFKNSEVFKNAQYVINQIIDFSELPLTASPATKLHGSATLPQGESGKPRYNSYVDWEIALLAAAGFALDLSSCGGCGRTDGLTHISKRTGRAVCEKCAAPFLDQCFPLPVDMSATEFFIARALETSGTKMPWARKNLS